MACVKKVHELRYILSSTFVVFVVCTKVRAFMVHAVCHVHLSAQGTRIYGAMQIVPFIMFMVCTGYTPFKAPTFIISMVCKRYTKFWYIQYLDHVHGLHTSYTPLRCIPLSCSWFAQGAHHLWCIHTFTVHTSIVSAVGKIFHHLYHVDVRKIFFPVHLG